jgi:hypothetical protein
MYATISNKPPQGKPFTFTASTLQHIPLHHLLFGDFATTFFSLFYNAVLKTDASEDRWMVAPWCDE